MLLEVYIRFLSARKTQFSGQNFQIILQVESSEIKCNYVIVLPEILKRKTKRDQARTFVATVFLI